MYTLPVLQRHCGFGRPAIDAARRNGLVTHRAGKRVFVLGSDFIYWVMNQNRPVAETEPQQQTVLPPKAAPKTLLTRTEAAEFLSLQPQTLAAWAVTGKGPKVTRLGTSVRYRIEDLEIFLQAGGKVSGEDE
jgi:hypothetical protein